MYYRGKRTNPNYIGTIDRNSDGTYTIPDEYNNSLYRKIYRWGPNNVVRSLIRETHKQFKGHKYGDGCGISFGYPKNWPNEVPQISHAALDEGYCKKIYSAYVDIYKR